MYLSQHTKVPDAPGKITFKKKGGSTYVLYETGRVYNKQRQWNVPQRAIIGKLVDESDRTLMQPNERFLELFPETPQIAPKELPSRRSSMLHAGTFIAFSAIIREYRLRELLEASFGEDAGFILDLASYLIITEDNAGQYYPDYARCHPLFTDGMRILSDSTISRFLAGMSRDDITSFLDDWNRKKDHRQRIYISYDSTNKNSQAGDLDLVEFGHAKEDKGLPILNVAVAYDKTNQVPLFYETYPGSIPDVSQLQYVIEKLDAYHYRSVGVVLDRGYFSRDNIKLMDEKGLSFLLMMKGCKKLVSSLIEDSRGSFEMKRPCRVTATNVYGTTVRRELFANDTKQRWFHLFYNPSKMAAEHADLIRKIDQMAEQLRKLEGSECELDTPYTDYFTCHYSEDNGKRRFLFAEEREDVIERETELCGYFCIVSSEKMTAEEAYHLYRGRDASEKLFRADKSFLGSRSQRVHTNEAVEAKIFIEFIALIVRNRFYNLLKEQMLRLNTRRNTMTVPGAIRELEKLEMTRRNGTLYLQDYALTKSQKMIFQAFGLSAEDVAVSTQKLTAILSALKDEKIREEEEGEDDAETEIDCLD